MIKDVETDRRTLDFLKYYLSEDKESWHIISDNNKDWCNKIGEDNFPDLQHIINNIIENKNKRVENIFWNTKRYTWFRKFRR